MDGEPIFKYDGETKSEKLARKTRDAPFMAIGILGCLGAIGIGAYKYKTKGNMSTSIYLMQFRVIAQGMVVSSLMVGIVYQMYKDYYLKPKSDLSSDGK